MTTPAQRIRDLKLTTEEIRDSGPSVGTVYTGQIRSGADAQFTKLLTGLAEMLEEDDFPPPVNSTAAVLAIADMLREAME